MPCAPKPALLPDPKGLASDLRRDQRPASVKAAATSLNENISRTMAPAPGGAS